MEVIEQLQRNRPEIVHLFDEIAKIMPEGTYLISLKQQGKNLILEGRAQSNARVSALMRNIEASPWLGNPQLQIIKKDEKSDSEERNFILRAVQISQADEKKAS